MTGKPSGVHHVALRVSDPERSLQFYGGVLGLPEVRRFATREGQVRSIWVQVGGVVVMLEREIRGAGPPAGSGHVLAFAVDDLAEWQDRLAQAGVVPDDRTASTLFVRDPDGHRVGLSVYALPREG
ncbi:MAG TPA: VOC family protein [Vicinamibacteria bacterium]|nr:VOC family protein [Vicinamibacteria bacterium]